MLSNNLTSLEPGQSPFAQKFRIDVNENFRRCIVGVRPGQGIRVDMQNGVAVISRDEPDPANNPPGGGSGLDEKVAATGTSAPGYLTDVLLADNKWILVDGTSSADHVVIRHISDGTVTGTYKTANLVVAGTTVTFTPIFVQYDEKGHFKGTVAGGDTSFDLSGASVIYSADETYLHLDTAEFQHKELAYGSASQSFSMVAGAGVSLSPSSFSFTVDAAGHVTTQGKSITISASVGTFTGSSLLSGDGTWTQLTGTVLYHIGPTSSSAGQNVSDLSEVLAQGTVSGVGGASISITPKTVKFDAKGHRATDSPNPVSGTVTVVQIPQALNDLSDVTITSPTTGDLLRYNGTVWVNYALTLATTAVPISWTVECSGTTFTVTVTGTVAVYRPG